MNYPLADTGHKTVDDLGSWVRAHRVTAHLVIPAVASLSLMALYFSGVQTLQSIVAPSIEGLPAFSWREFGALETMQNLVLLAIIFQLVEALIRLRGPCVKLGCTVLLTFTAFLFLEEIDYGAHWVGLLTEQKQPLSPHTWGRNVHNRLTEDGVQYGSYMKAASKVIVVLVFVAAPFLLRRSTQLAVRLLRPSRWMAATAFLMFLLSLLAHALDQAGLSEINGIRGNLQYNISEFRELNLYYLFLLYFVDLRCRFRTFGT
ncbi:MAG: hypothetical protein V2I48_08265 [Xanthomonadales bacterium]|jgi:hypothetical protein|nr:hypothetical protein [Xanthomonadales bacterium]